MKYVLAASLALLFGLVAILWDSRTVKYVYSDQDYSLGCDALTYVFSDVETCDYIVLGDV